MSKTTSEQHTYDLSLPQEALRGVVDPVILDAPRLNWEHIDPRFIRYLKTQVNGTPWVNHLALLVAVLVSHTKSDMGTVKVRMYTLHARWRTIFSSYNLVTFKDWSPAEHLPRYINDKGISDTFETRQAFLKIYSAASHHLQTYLRSLPAEMRTIYQQWELPALPAEVHAQLFQGREIREAEFQRRKAETDALTPHFARIRSEAHLRWNQLQRLRTKFREAIQRVQSGQESLPLPFSYEESSSGQRLHFKLWDRNSFVEAHAEEYSPNTVWKSEPRMRGFPPEKNQFFLECVGTEMLGDPGVGVDPHRLLWFGDLLHLGLLSMGATAGTPEEIQYKQMYLRSWGYGAEEDEQGRKPFRTDIPGLLAWPNEDRSSSFLRQAQRRANGLLLLVEPLFAAATFGLAAVDFFTTTGARVSELLQVSLTPDCLYTLVVEDSQRLLMRLVPKGTDSPADYVVGTETRANFEKVAHLLQDHYQLRVGEAIPSVHFSNRNWRAHQFPDSRPYLFQYNGRHLSPIDITACLHFLCHGMVFQTAEGRAVVLKAHSLRHVFATHIHQVEQVPLDVVAMILHQKDVRVTGYYAAPPWQQVLNTANTLLDRFATQLGSLEEAFVRAPAELQQQLEEAKQRVGTLAKVPGGDCVCHAICPISFACAGCVFKVPDPDREDEIQEQEQWAFIRLEQVKRRGLGPEAVKMQALIQRCKTEREEMKQMREYRKDERYEPVLTVEHRI